MKRTVILAALMMALASTLIGWMPSNVVRSSASERAFTPAALPQSQPPGPIRLIPGLVSLTFWERTGSSPVDNTFSVNSPQLEARLSTLDFASRDFTGASLEFYDVFYSGADGSANRDGAYVTIEAIWNLALPNGGGLNIAEVQLNFAPGDPTVFGNVVTSFVGLGDNFAPGSVPNAVDGNLQSHTTMGNTVGQSQRLRITIGFPPPPPGCRYSISPTSQTFTANGGTGAVDVLVPSGCDWGALVADSDTNHLPLVQLASNDRRSGSGTVSYSVTPVTEDDTATRSATIEIRAFPLFNVVQRFVVTREAFACPASAYSIHPSNVVVEGDSDGGLLSFQVTAPPGCSWTANTREPWITLPSGQGSGSGSGRVFFTVLDNPGSWRGGLISVGGKLFTVYQNDTACPQAFVCGLFPIACGSGTLVTSRRFRDNRLARSVRGQRYTQLYYKFSTEAVGLMILSPSLVLRSRDILERYKPVIDKMANGEPVTLTQGDVEDIDSFLDAFASRGSTELRETLKSLSEDLRDPRVLTEFNITITDGPKRQARAQGPVQTVVQTSIMIAPIGLLLFSLYRIRLRRNKKLQ